MANEKQVGASSIADVTQGMVDLGMIPVNLLVNGVQTLAPVAGLAVRTLTDVVAASAGLISCTAGSALGVITSAGAPILNSAGAIVAVPFNFIGNIAGSALSAVQSGMGFVINTASGLIPARKI